MDKKDLNNKVILLRKSLKSIFNQTKLNLSRKIKSLKKNEKQKQSALRKESELEALKRIKPSDVPLFEGVFPEKLHKTLTNPNSTEHERAVARVLINPLVQKTIQQLKEKLGPETVETFLKDNATNIKKNIKQKLENPKKAKQKKIKGKASEKVEPEVSESDAGSDVEEDREGSESEQEEAIPHSDEDKGEGSENDSSDEIMPMKKKPEKKLEPIKPSKPVATVKSNDSKPPRKRGLKEVVVKKSSDPFFMDSSGTNYLAAVADGASSASEDEAERPMLKKQPQKAQKFTQKFKPIKTKRFDETPPAIAKRMNQPVNKRPEFKVNQPVRKPEFKVNKPEIKAQQPMSAKPTDGDIHPSWKAKAQMRKTQIQDFQGTKIKFDD